MELRHIRYFLVVAEELHFGRAAARLNMTQPPLSVAVRGLERELGYELLRRSTRAVTLTPSGREFVARFGPIIQQLDLAIAESKQIACGTRGHVRIGFISSANHHILPQALRKLRDTRPHLQVDLEPLTSIEQLDALMNGEIDLAIVRDAPEAPGLVKLPLTHEPLVVVVEPGHPLAGHASVAPAQLAGEPIITFPYRLMPGYLDRVYSVFEAARVELNLQQQVVHQETALGLVAAGMGITILPDSMRGVIPERVAVIPLESDVTSAVQVMFRQDDAHRTSQIAADLVAVEYRH